MKQIIRNTFVKYLENKLADNLRIYLRVCDKESTTTDLANKAKKSLELIIKTFEIEKLLNWKADAEGNEYYLDRTSIEVLYKVMEQCKDAFNTLENAGIIDIAKMEDFAKKYDNLVEKVLENMDRPDTKVFPMKPELQPEDMQDNAVYVACNGEYTVNFNGKIMSGNLLDTDLAHYFTENEILMDPEAVYKMIENDESYFHFQLKSYLEENNLGYCSFDISDVVKRKPYMFDLTADAVRIAKLIKTQDEKMDQKEDVSSNLQSSSRPSFFSPFLESKIDSTASHNTDDQARSKRLKD